MRERHRDRQTNKRKRDNGKRERYRQRVLQIVGKYREITQSTVLIFR